MNFAEVTDVVIPQGSVTKIAETLTGRVLWQKELPIPKTHWEIVELPNADSNGTTYLRPENFVDTGDGLEFFDDYGHYKYSTNGVFGDISSIVGITLSSYNLCADIDPVSKIWGMGLGRRYASNVFSGIKETDELIGAICWSPKLQCFCVIGNKWSRLIDWDGEIQGVSEGIDITMSGLEIEERLSWFTNLEKFVFPQDGAIYVSSDGLIWTKKAIIIKGTLPDITLGNRMKIVMSNICWMSSIKKFVTICHVFMYNDNTQVDGKTYLLSSSNLNEWEYVKAQVTGFDIHYLYSKLAYSEEKKVLAILNHYSAYVTRDLENFVAVPYTEDMPQNVVHVGKWSTSFKSFIRIIYSTPLHFSKLVIDN